MARDNFLTEPDKPIIAFQDIVENSRIVAETASDAIITINETSTMLYVNRAAEAIFGYSKEEMLGSELTMLMPEYIRHVHRAGLKGYLETGQKHISWEAVELEGLHKNGTRISLELSFGEFSRDGHRFFTGIARDITRRKQIEHRLALQHSVSEILATAPNLSEAAPQLLKTICDNLGWQFAGIWSVATPEKELRPVAHWRSESSADAAQFEAISRDSSVTPGVGFLGTVWATKQPMWVSDFASDNFPRSSMAAKGNLHAAFGFPIMLTGQVLGVIELFSDEIRDTDPSMLNTVTAIANQIGQYIERKKGEQELVHALDRAHEAWGEAEKLSKQLASVQRMTEAALSHLSVGEVLDESLNRIRDVLKVDTVAILLLETEGDELVAWAAQGLEEEVETGVRIPVGQGFAGRIVAERRPIVIDDITKADVHNPLLREKGIKSLLGVPLLLEGRPTGVLHVGKLEFANFTHDDVKLLELAADRIALAIENARLYEVERTARAEAEAANRAKDEFLTILSHELRTPLTPIIGWVHMMQNRILPDEEFIRVLSIVNRNAYSLKRLINDLLDMSAILSGKMRIEEASVSLASVLEESIETMRPYAHDSKVHLRLRIADEAATVTVTGDRSRLNQTFCNILHNAIKFSPSGGYVDASLEAKDSEALIRVKDQGEGISSEFLPHVFERFRQEDSSRTRSFGGLGLGLALVKSFVEAHGGTVDVASEGQGKGSSFEVKLPRENAQRHETKPTTRKRELNDAASRTRILVVEDQPDTLEMLSANFESRGYEVLRCTSAPEALELAGRENFDILISDIGMPGMDGLQLIQKLRQQEGLKSLPAIALTGYASQKDVSAAISAGFNRHVSKPIDPTDLVQTIESLLDSEVHEDFDHIQ
jgi:PAS domain S-box-containing protein